MSSCTTGKGDSQCFFSFFIFVIIFCAFILSLLISSSKQTMAVSSVSIRLEYFPWLWPFYLILLSFHYMLFELYHRNWIIALFASIIFVPVEKIPLFVLLWYIWTLFSILFLQYIAALLYCSPLHIDYNSEMLTTMCIFLSAPKFLPLQWSTSHLNLTSEHCRPEVYTATQNGSRIGNCVSGGYNAIV